MSENDQIPDFDGEGTVFGPPPASTVAPPPEQHRNETQIEAQDDPAKAPSLVNAQPHRQGSTDDKTLFWPNPGGRRPLRAAASPAPKPAAPSPRQSAVQALNLAAPNANPILQAAGPLLLLLGRLRAALLRAQGSGLRPQIAAAIETCEREMRAAGVAADEANRAKYILCATADEVLASLPGEDRAIAAQPDLTTRCFGEEPSGRRFFDEIDRVKADPKAHYFLLELLHACLALGFQGAHLTLPVGAATLQEIRHDLHDLLQNTRPAPAQGLSPRWQGQPLTSHAVRVRVPLWTTAGVVALMLFGVFIGFRVLLGQKAEAAAETIGALNPPTPVTLGRKVAVAPPPAPPPTLAQASQLDHIRMALEPSIAAGTLSVDSTANQIVIHITDKALFQPGKSAILDAVRPLMKYIALALDDEKGVIKVVGHSDNTPISNARFASNFELSLERAEAVGALLKQSLAHPERVETEGKGADAPIASNDTAEGRGKNRRVEIVVPRSD